MGLELGTYMAFLARDAVGKARHCMDGAFRVVRDSGKCIGLGRHEHAVQSHVGFTNSRRTVVTRRGDSLQRSHSTPSPRSPRSSPEAAVRPNHGDSGKGARGARGAAHVRFSSSGSVSASTPASAGGASIPCDTMLDPADPFVLTVRVTT
ncbi:LAQU0S04e02762g1_1 [Lachancea quebecensis]|uniref:LAQU0S04e02762g1_1 n=1 Tax=Lachancea quebecensis TaxID=1654605 RepID=A0A0P1KSE6_9SACH|nr:LAQU0S04e02762g1_1 [Lachancea quebecensis]